MVMTSQSLAITSQPLVMTSKPLVITFRPLMRILQPLMMTARPLTMMCPPPGGYLCLAARPDCARRRSISAAVWPPPAYRCCPLACTWSWPQASVHSTRIPRSVGALPSGLKRGLMTTSQSCHSAREDTRRASTAPCPPGVGTAEAKCCCRTVSGGFLRRRWCLPQLSLP